MTEICRRKCGADKGGVGVEKVVGEENGVRQGRGGGSEVAIYRSRETREEIAITDGCVGPVVSCSSYLSWPFQLG